MGLIYLATNKKNGKYYIGKTNQSLEIRIKNHLRSREKNSRKFYFHRSIKKRDTRKNISLNCQGLKNKAVFYSWRIVYGSSS